MTARISKVEALTSADAGFFCMVVQGRILTAFTLLNLLRAVELS